MRAIVQEVPGNECSLQVGEVTMPAPIERELLIRVSYSALNQIDLLQVMHDIDECGIDSGQYLF
jgi:NADPH:quinone reductase-like Zn-dependent oxidoreductase